MNTIIIPPSMVKPQDLHRSTILNKKARHNDAEPFEINLLHHRR